MKNQLLAAILLLSGANADLEAQCTATSPKNPQNAYNVDGFPGTSESAWVYADGVKASSGLCILGNCAVSAQLTSILSVGNKNTENLVVQNFAVNIPPTATVCGIEVVVRKHAIGLNDRVYDVSMKLRKNGAVIGANRKKEAKWGSSVTSFTYGGPNDLWGTTWTAANVNAANFGVEFVANVDYTFSLAQLLSLDISLLPQAHVDHISVIVYYANPLPVELIGFDGVSDGQEVRLNWSTGSESGNDYYTVERSMDAVNFTKLGTVEGAGNSTVKLSYSFADENPLPGINYYRLKQTDFNGVTEIFGPITVDYRTARLLSIYPNPAKEGFMVHFNTEPNAVYSLAMVNLNGVEVQREENAASNEFIECRHLARGMYYVQLYGNGRMVAMAKVVLE